MPEIRMRAVLKVRNGWSIRRAARYFGFHHTALIRWMRRAPADGRMTIPTTSSRPHRHPRALSPEVVARIVAQRKKHRRCAEVVQEEFKRSGVVVSLSSVKHTLSGSIERSRKNVSQRFRIRQQHMLLLCQSICDITMRNDYISV